jgi:signal transduction histidine kinase/ligand-binding sensor domain-containing protein
LPILGYSQIQKPSFTHYTNEDGLSYNNVTCIYQDSEGFMWFGTEDGLNRFDGKIFTIYNRTSHPDIFTSNYIFEIIEDSHENLWICSGNGLICHNIRQNTFRLFKPDNSSITGNSIRNIIEDHNGLLWIGTSSGQLNIYNPQTELFTVFNSKFGDKFNPKKTAIVDLIEDSKGRIWVAYDADQIVTNISKDRNQVRNIILDDLSNQIMGQREIIVKDSSIMWVGTLGNGIYEIDARDFSNIKVKNIIPQSNNENSLAGNRILCFRRDGIKGIWVGLENTGLTYYDLKKGIFTNFSNDPTNSSSISNNSIWSLFLDNSGGLWAGSYSSGINYRNPFSKPFNHVYNNPLNTNSLNSNIISSFLKDSKGLLWIGTDGGGINLYDDKKEQFRFITTKNSQLSSDAILNIYEDSKNNIWIGTWAGGIVRLYPNRKTMKVYNASNSSLIGKNFSSAVEDQNGILWFGSYWGQGGICYYDEKKNDFISFTKGNSNIVDNTIYRMISGTDGYLWIATHNGISKFDPVKKVFTNYSHNPKDSTTISHPNVHTIIETKDSVIWAGTASGLNSFDRKTGQFKRYYASNSNIPDNYVFSLEEGEPGEIWVSCKKGLYVLNTKNNEVINHSKSDGLQGKTFVKNSSYKSPEGTLYFGGTNGYNSFTPLEISRNTFCPPLVFTGLKIFDKEVVFGTKDTPLEKRGIEDLDTLYFTHHQNVFTLEYTCLNFSYSDKTNYAYMLEGFDTEWKYVGDLNNATYQNLPAGSYLFKLKVPNENGFGNDEGISMHIIIIPPFYETWLFRISLAIFLSGLIIMIFYMRVRNLSKRNKELEIRVKERTMEIKNKNEILEEQSIELMHKNGLLEARNYQIMEQSEELSAQKEELIIQRDELTSVNADKDRLFSIIGHDLRNPFANLIGFVEILNDKSEVYSEVEKKEMIKMIYDSSFQIFELLQQILDWSVGQSGKISFNPTLENLNLLIHKNISLCSTQAKNKNINIVFNAKADAKNLILDANLVNTIIRNFINNAIKFTPPEGTIKVWIENNTNETIVAVRDSGIGMPKEIVDKILNKGSYYSSRGTNNEIGTGLGLKICKDFALKHGGEIGIESKVGEGTTMTLILPHIQQEI